MKQYLYTFIAEYRGGTYCMQVEAADVNNAAIAWTAKLESGLNEIQFLGKKGIVALQNAVLDPENQPSPLTGLQNVWFTLYRTRQGAFFVNIVQTEGS